MRFEGPVSGVPGAVVRSAEGLPARLAGGARVGPCVEVKEGAWLLAMPRVARVLVSEGRTIDVQALPGAEPELIDVIVDTSARAALIQQRGELALEATTVAAPGGACVALSGFSGLGKSTIAAALTQRGWRLVADGVTRVVADGGRVVAWPSHEAVKLWRNACEALSIDADGASRVRKVAERFYVPVPAMAEPMPLTAIVRLIPEEGLQSSVVPAEERLPMLSDCTYRVGQIGPMGREAECTRTATVAADACTMLKLSGARKASITALADAIVEAAR